MAALHFLDDFDIDELVQRFGSPLFVFSARTMENTIRSMQRAFCSRYADTKFVWPYKTNYLGAILDLVHAEGLGAEIVSEMEFQKAERYDLPAGNIVFNGPYKQSDTLRKVIQGGGLVNIDHLDEIGDIEAVAEALGRKVPVGIRLNLDAGGDATWRRFGFVIEDGQADAAVKQIIDSGLLDLCALHAHVGTSITDLSVYRRLVREMVRFANHVTASYECSISVLDIGGGIASSCLARHAPADSITPSHDQYAAAICKTLLDSLSPDHRPELLIESGRALIDDAGALITSIVGTKVMPDARNCYVVDAGINLLHTASTHRLKVQPAAMSAKPLQESVVVGPLCMHSDVVCDSVALPKMKRGERLIVSPVGAYNTSLWSQFIQHRPCVVMIDQSGAPHLIREAETNSDVEAKERRPTALVHMLSKPADST